MSTFPLRAAIDEIGERLTGPDFQTFMDLMESNGLHPCSHEDAWETEIRQAEGTLVYSCGECAATWTEDIS